MPAVGQHLKNGRNQKPAGGEKVPTYHHRSLHEEYSIAQKESRNAYAHATITYSKCTKQDTEVTSCLELHSSAWEVLGHSESVKIHVILKPPGYMLTSSSGFAALIHLEVYSSIDFSEMIVNSLEVLNFDWFICNQPPVLSKQCYRVLYLSFLLLMQFFFIINQVKVLMFYNVHTTN